MIYPSVDGVSLRQKTAISIHIMKLFIIKQNTACYAWRNFRWLLLSGKISLTLIIIVHLERVDMKF